MYGLLTTAATIFFTALWTAPAELVSFSPAERIASVQALLSLSLLTNWRFTFPKVARTWARPRMPRLSAGVVVVVTTEAGFAGVPAPAPVAAGGAAAGSAAPAGAGAGGGVEAGFFNDACAPVAGALTDASAFCFLSSRAWAFLVAAVASVMTIPFSSCFARRACVKRYWAEIAHCEIARLQRE